MPRGSRPGERRGGRQKGTPNKITAVQREFFQAFLDRNADELQKMLEEVRFGIEIEKQTDQGTVVGRLNADPKGAFDLLLKVAEFCLPKLGRTELTGKDGQQLKTVFRIEEPD